MTLNLQATGCAILVVCGAALAQTASFRGIGQMPGPLIGNAVVGVSADGRFVAGTAGDPSSPDTVAFRWLDGDFESLGQVPGETFGTQASIISSDGTTIAGCTGGNARPWKWKDGTLSIPSCDISYVSLPAIKGDGSAYILKARNGGALLISESYCGGLGFPPVSFQYVTSAVDDFSAISVALPPGSYFGAIVFRDGSLLLPPPRMQNSDLILSRSGRFVVGSALWDRQTGIVLDVPMVVSSVYAHQLADDGQVVVGRGVAAEVWIPTQYYPQRLDCLLQRLGVDIGEWTLTDAVAVSADGTVVVGNGRNPQGTREGWVAHLPRIPLSPDLNQDRFLDFTDFDTFVLSFERGDVASDFNQDGFLDFTDFDDFVTAFEIGC